jgi:hypothetical protein
MTTNNTIVAAFESWSNGGQQTSSLVLLSKDGKDALNLFLERAASSFATLHTFNCEEEAKSAFDLF